MTQLKNIFTNVFSGWNDRSSLEVFIANHHPQSHAEVERLTSQYFGSTH
ncbi:hypothetical protein [Polynucleobacter brandtiae]|uniref:Uncharacterized protein n=1 Tax=Polynucleobacter brandtiae TaxID=1938816 RepID=A0A2M8VIV1_9BURK|nr:hypothetical protein [Polynucleobacter brandtiae]PJI76782.1 hypothetical protein B0G85_1991 [Polynucleobacter brandtiae]